MTGPANGRRWVLVDNVAFVAWGYSITAVVLAVYVVRLRARARRAARRPNDEER